CPCCPSEPLAAVPLRPPEASLAPAERLWSADGEGAVRLRMEESGPAADAPRTVHQMFLETSVEAFGERRAVASKEDGRWRTLTWAQYYRECRTAAKSFIKLGLERYHGVGILGFNAPEWFIANVGCILAG
uniref:AMP-dependent synthetase/ligase domain-containing protein n=1 Tax=Hippocampus comes TaxID=109280 RepID=A0A3Q2YTU3_HIPCM